MSQRVDVLSPGSAVVVGNDVPAVVSAVMVESDFRVSYRVTWWEGRTRKSEWLDRGEVQSPAAKPERLGIGFRQGEA